MGTPRSNRLWIVATWNTQELAVVENQPELAVSLLPMHLIWVRFP